MKLKKGKTWQMGLRYFEEFVKRNFNEDEHQEVNVPYVHIPVRRLPRITHLANRVADSLGYQTTKKPGLTRASSS